MSVTGGERRIVTALFADVVDSTEIAERLGPERSKFFFDDVVRLMRQEVERFGGTVGQLTGDGLMAFFGAPTAHEDDASRAVRAALSIREAVARYGGEVAAAYDINLAARVALNTGPVVLPGSDTSPEFLYNALGDTVNLAARLQAMGEVVVGPETARQIEHSFELAPLGQLELKGISEPVLAFRVVGPRETAALRTEATFVGRAAEVAVLDDVFNQLLGGRGAIVSITGEPGIGKSRLVTETSQRFAGTVRFLSGHAAPFAEEIPYWPVRELLRAWLGVGVSDPEARVRLELRAALSELFGDSADDAYPILASVLGLALEPVHEQRLRDFATDAIQRQMFDWIYQLVRALAAEKPLCIVLEDLQSADDATLTLLGEILPVAEQAAVAFLLVHRSDPDHHAWQIVDRARRRFRPLFVDLELEPLADVDVRSLAEATAGEPLTDELMHLLAERAGGNPYFVGEAIRDLGERAPRDNAGRRAFGTPTAFPTALQGALQARLDRLDTDARELISIAAVIGRTFSFRLLERLLPRARLLPVLSELQWLQLLVDEGGSLAPEYRFRHGLVQEVAYAALVDAHRRDLHLRVGEALLELYTDTSPEVLGLLARHFAEADDPTRAVEYLLRAGDAARNLYAQDEAISLYRRALLFMDRTADDGRARETLLKIGLTHHVAFDFRLANEAFAQAFEHAAPAPLAQRPTEEISWALTAAWDGTVAPGHSYTIPAAELTRNLFRGLLAMGRDSYIEPDLAERFSISDDGLLYRFTVRADARWSDGERITATDFAFTAAKIVEENFAMASWFDGVSAIAVDERTIEYRLRAVRNDFLYLLSQPYCFPWPRHAFERDGRDWHRVVPLVGSGPFALTERAADRLVMVASDHRGPVPGNVATVTVEIVVAPETAADRWRRGDFDILDSSLIAEAVADSRTAVLRSPAMQTWYVGFAANRPPFDDVRVRLAAAHALDRSRTVPFAQGPAAGSGGVIPPAMPGHSHRVAPAYDVDRAKRLLSDAGFPGGGGLGVIVLACLDLWQGVAADVAAQLESVGMRTQLLSVATDSEMEAAANEEASAYVWGFIADYPDPGRGFLDPFYRQPRLYRDDRLDALLEAAASLRDQDERLRSYREFERIWIGEQAGVVPLAYGEALLWTRPWISGMWLSPTQTSTLADAVVNRPSSGATG